MSINDKQLLSAAACGRSEEVLSLVTNGANVTCKDSQRRTPLSWAARNGHIEVVKALLDNGALIKNWIDESAERTSGTTTSATTSAYSTGGRYTVRYRMCTRQ